ncbi:MAG: serine/threonine-protein kinase, partial [Thermoanaerobaculia bacterium]
MSISTCSQCGHAAPPDVRQCPKCGATLTARTRGMASTRFETGDVIDGRYEVVERIRGGGMGELYKVRHVHLGEFRVIKLLRDDQLADETQRKRFFQEARIAASIKHPNVGLLHDFAALADGTFYMVEEFIDGVTISRSIRGGRRYSLGEIVDITRQVLLGLVAIHEKGIIHRDISPDNIILSQIDGNLEVRIIDLGIAKPMVAGEGHALTSAGLFVGKPHYASPEQMRMIETDEKIDHRSDIYSLGVVIYEMIVGRVPFEAATPLAYLLKQVSEEIHTVNRDVSGVVPPELDAFIVRMLKTKRDERFATARDALRALDEAIAGIPQLLYRTELGVPDADESFPRAAPKTRKRGTDEVPFDQLAAIIQHDRTEPGATATPIPVAEEEEGDDDVPATEVQSLAGLMTTTQPYERLKPQFETVEAEAPSAGPDRTVPATTPVPPSEKGRRGKNRAITIAVICTAFLVVVSAGGWLFYRLLESRFGQGQPNVVEPAAIPTTSVSPATAPGVGSPEPAATETTTTAVDPVAAQPGVPAAA